MIKGRFNTENASNRFKMYMINLSQLGRGKLSTFHSVKEDRLYN